MRDVDYNKLLADAEDKGSFRVLQAYVRAVAFGLTDEEAVYVDTMSILLPDMHYNSVTNYAHFLWKAGFLERDDERNGFQWYYITPDGIREAVRRGFIPGSMSRELWPNDDREVYMDAVDEASGGAEATREEWAAWVEGQAAEVGHEVIDRVAGKHEKLMASKHGS